MKYTLPANSYGSGPDPAATEALPSSLPGGQVPALASASSHCCTEGIAPSSPGGSVVATPPRYCWPSARVSAKE